METKYPYSQESTTRVRRLLEIAHEGGNPQAFEVFADGVRLVPRTTKLELFDEAIEKLLPKNFGAVEVKIYFGASNLNDSYVLECETQNIKQESQQQQYQQPLGETNQPQFKPNNQPDDLDKKIQTALEAERTKWKKEQLEADNANLKEEIKDKERYIDSLERALLEANKGNGWKENLEGLITNGLKIYQTIHGTSQPQQTSSLGNAPQGQQHASAHFEEETEEEVSEFEHRLRAIVQQVDETFSPYQAQAFIDLLTEVVSHRKQIVDVLAIVKARLYGKRNRRHERRQQERSAGPQQQNVHYKQQSQQPFSVVQPHTEQPVIIEEEEENDYDDQNQ